MLNIREPMKGRTRLHHLRLVREIGEAGMDEDAKAEVEVLDRMLECSRPRVQVKDRAKGKHKDNKGKQAISRMPVTNVEELATEPMFVQVKQESTEDEDEEDEVVIAGDVSVAEARDVTQAMRAWLEPAKLKVLEPNQHLPSRRETSEAPDWPVQWTDGGCTPEPSKPIWRGSKASEDLIIADAKEKIT